MGLYDDRVSQREALACPLPDFFRRKKWVEDFGTESIRGCRTPYRQREALPSSQIDENGSIWFPSPDAP